MSISEKISALIGRIYAGAHDSASWDRAMETVQEITGSRLILVSSVDLGARAYSSTRIYGPDDARFQDGMRDYMTDVYRSDPTLAFGIAYPNAGQVTTREAVAREGYDFEDHPYAQWATNILGIGDGLVCYTAPADDLILGVSIHPDARRGTHDPDELRLFTLLFDHIEHALRLAARPLDFGSVDDARLLVDARGRVRMVSMAARDILARGDGLFVGSGRLRAARRADSARIDNALRSAISALEHGGVGGVVSVARPSGRRAWLLKISPLINPPGPFEAFRPAAQVRIIDQEAQVPAGSVANWAQTFRLTPAETRLTELLLAGEGNLRDAAAQLGMAYATARVHLTHIFDKVGVRSQAQLVRLLTRIGAWLVGAVVGINALAGCADLLSA